MKKKLVVVLLSAAMCVAALGGCGSKAGSSSDSSKKTAENSSKEDDQKAADEVAKKIDAIYVQERNDKTDEQCKEAKEAWDKLTDAQKELVEGENADPDYFGRDTGDASKDDPLNQDEIGENEILVRVDNSMQPGSRWYSGSGITRDVWLEKRYPIHIARYGMYLTTDEGNLNISTTLHTSECMKDDDSLSLTFMLKDQDGEEAAKKDITLKNDWTEADLDAAILSGMDADVPKTLCQLTTSLSIKIENPVLWDHETPYLYELTTILKKNDTVIDERTDKVGFRNIEFDAKKGFLINGKHVKLNGVCLHHDGGCVGAAVPPEIWRRRLEKLKDMGVNSVRCSHNPPDEALLDLCDELGFYVMDEAFDEWRLMKAKEIGSNTHESHGYSMYFDACHEWDLKTMLYRDRNHPGIVLWSIGNEIPEEVVVGGEELAVELSGYCHTIDPTRKVTLAHDQIAAEPYSARDAFMDKIDVVGYNYVGRWRERAELLYDADREEHLDRCVIGTENPSAGYIRSDYNFEVDPGSFWNKPYYTAAVTVGKLLRYTMVHDFVAGDYMWTGIDYLGEANWPQRSAGCGCLDTCGFEKDAFYFYKSVWNQKEKFAYLCPHWNLKLEKGTVLPVICYTNCEDAELFVNGRSFGMKSKGFPCYGMTERYGHFDRYRRPANTDDLFLSWDVPYEPGKIEVVGYHDGKEVCRYNVETTGEAALIKLTVDKTSVDAEEVLFRPRFALWMVRDVLFWMHAQNLILHWRVMQRSSELIMVIQRVMSSGRKLRDVMHLMEWLMRLFVQDKTREN